MPATAAVDFDRYVQLDALVEAFFTFRDPDAFDRSLLPDISLDGAYIVGESPTFTQGLSRKIDATELFARVVPSGEEDSERSQLVSARSLLLGARILRSIRPDAINERAAGLEAHAGKFLSEIHLRGMA